MGTGENVAILMLLELLLAGKGALMVVDEIELGLHVGAQKKLINELKEICKNNHSQIICSTHSDVILDSLPPEGRFFIETTHSRTLITPGISSKLAFGQLADSKTNELDIFVEDDVAKTIIEKFVDHKTRKRINLITIGSHTAVARQIAARFREAKLDFVAFIDGDKHNERDQHVRNIRSHIEKIDDEGLLNDFLSKRLVYLVEGVEHPELAIVKCLSENHNNENLLQLLGVSEEEAKDFLTQASIAGPHNEFYHLANLLSIEKNEARNKCIEAFAGISHNEVGKVRETIEQALRGIDRTAKTHSL